MKMHTLLCWTSLCWFGLCCVQGRGGRPWRWTLAARWGAPALRWHAPSHTSWASTSPSTLSTRQMCARAGRMRCCASFPVSAAFDAICRLLGLSVAGRSALPPPARRPTRPPPLPCLWLTAAPPLRLPPHCCLCCRRCVSGGGCGTARWRRPTSWWSGWPWCQRRWTGRECASSRCADQLGLPACLPALCAGCSGRKAARRFGVQAVAIGWLAMAGWLVGWMILPP